MRSQGSTRFEFELGVRSMTTQVAEPQVAEPDAATALYPPTVIAPPRPLPLRRFLLTFVRNPLRSVPQSVYEQPISSTAAAATSSPTSPIPR